MDYASFFFHVLHWLNVELWTPGWANILMPSVWTFVGFVIADVRQEVRHRRQKPHVVDIAAVGELVGQIEAMSDRLKTLVEGEEHADE